MTFLTFGNKQTDTANNSIIGSRYMITGLAHSGHGLVTSTKLSYVEPG